MKIFNLQIIRLSLLMFFFLLLGGSGIVTHAQIAPAPGPDGIDSSLSYRMLLRGGRAVSPIRKYVMNGDDPFAAVRHCNETYLFPTYVGSIDTYTLFTRNPLTGRTPYDVQWRIQEEGVYTYPVGGGFASGTEATPIEWSFATPGYKYFQFIINDLSLRGKPDTLIVKVLVMKQVTDLIIDMPTLCLDDFSTGTDYKFTVETLPAFETVFTQNPSSHLYWTGGYCELVGDLRLKFKFDNTASLFSGITRSEFGKWSSFGYSEFWLGGYAFPIWPDTSTPFSRWSDVKKFYLSNADITSYIGFFPMPLLGKLSYDDGITTIEKNYLIPIDNKFLIWEYNKRTPSALFGYTAFPYGTVIAADHETWTPTNNPMVNEGYGPNVPIIRIKDTLIIGKGQSLTIKDMTVEMGKDAQIIVESDRAGIVAAGRLILDNSTIKAYRDCGNENDLWKGIILQGNTGKPQTAIGGDFAKRYQAMLFMANNASIADAEVAVRTYDPSIANTAGGLVYAANSSFRNNLLAIDISPYGSWTTGKNYLNNYTNCSFVADDENIKMSFKGFVQGCGVEDIRFNSCSFVTDYSTVMVGFGIKGTNMGVLVRGSATGTAPCYFKGLQEAVSVNKTAFYKASILSVTNAQFEQNYSAVYTKAVANPTIANNVLHIPNKPSPSYFGRNCTGINIETGSGYDISSNSFGPVAASSSTTASGNNAVLVWNSGSADNFVKGNTVSNLNQGMISNFMNRAASSSTPKGLQFLCNNQSLNVGTCLAALGADPSQDGMRAEQGSNSRAAGNGFAHLYYDIYNPASEVGAVNYFYNSAPNANPTMNVGSVFTNLTSATDGCTTLPTKTYPPTLIATTGYTGAALREVIRNNIDYYAEHYELATRSSELHAALGSLADAYSDLARVDLYIEDHDTEAANSLYNGIVASRGLAGKEALEFSHWGRQLLDMSIALQAANTEPTQLSTAQVATLAGIADSAQMWAKVRAQNWLQSYDGRSFVNTFMYPPNNIGGTLRKVLDESISQVELVDGVYPNPAQQYIDVVYTVQNEKGISPVIEIRDLMGRLVLQQSLNINGKQRISIEKLAVSVYLYRISEDGQSKREGKLIKN